jgi:hypothetical protein
VLLDRGRGELALRVLEEGGDMEGLHLSELGDGRRSHQAEKRGVAFMYALRV